MKKYLYYIYSAFELILFIRPFNTIFKTFLGRKPPSRSEIYIPRAGVKFTVRGVMDIWSVKETFLDRFYERMSTPIQKNWVILDIGGGIGDFTTFAARSHSSCKVFVFEPTPESFDILQLNLVKNTITNAESYQQAVWSQNGILTIDTSTGEPGQFISRSIQETHQVKGQISVQSLSLEEVFRTLNLDSCDLVKMDCEGAEYPILFNTPDKILFQINRLVMEYHDNVSQYTHSDLERFLKEKGFIVQSTPNIVHNYLGYLYASRV